MVNIKNTLDELKDILNTIKTKQDANTAWTGTEQADIEKRIKHVYDKTNPRHTNLSADLEIDLKELEALSKTIGEKEIATSQEIKKLQDEKAELEKNKTANEALIKQKDEEIGKKITKEFIEKLEKLEPGKVDETKIAELKTLLTSIKDKGITADLTETNKKLEELKETAKKDQKLPYWSIAATVLSSLALLTTLYLVFTKQSQTSSREDE